MKGKGKGKGSWKKLGQLAVLFLCCCCFLAGFFGCSLTSQEIPSVRKRSTRLLKSIDAEERKYEILSSGESGDDSITSIPFQVLSWRPRTVYFPKFATSEQCESIIDMAKQKLKPSNLALREGETEESTKGVRTSSGMFISAAEDKTGVLDFIEEKIARATMIPRKHGEEFNILRYEVGQKYNSHYDAFNPAEYGPQKSQRVASFLLYLSDVEEGGETIFPFENGNIDTDYDFVKCTGLKVKPRRGDGLLFYSLFLNGTIDPASLHGSCPVIKGEKWVATKWIRNEEQNMTSVAAQCYNKAMISITRGLPGPYRWQDKHQTVLLDKQKPSHKIVCHNQRSTRGQPIKKQEMYPQNVDLPSLLPKNKKKPYPIPIKEIQRIARAEKKLAEMGVEKQLEPPKNGLLVPELIPVAHDVLNAWKDLIKGLAQLLHVIPVYACSECPGVHVAETGHQIQDCHGPSSAKRRGFHSWVKASINDVLLPIDCYHLFDPFGRRIKHETRFDYDRIPAVVELCIQAGVDLPGYPSRRRTRPIRMIGKKVIDRGGFLAEPKPSHPGDSSSPLVDFDTHGAMSRFQPPRALDVPTIAQETMDASEKVTHGVRRLMAKYSVKACGYCSEVHVGPWGHNAKLCGEFKHQWRDGKHGWQDAIADEVFPPNYVWHVRDLRGPPLRTALKRFYGKAPAVVEVCMQAGARVPERYKPMMRLDIVLPDSDEAGLVA
ncbi:hypothetical protein Nepgr_016665 [Nepenthes gracilis]|uniref:procollagen-proline 4-dioxygenase n=1 Tax=Nepenthes gracilis TaxID=150966 RepID=A0AAD3SQ44_NEPGR|nr:hypothetical protein Nepgr_016665 [Nepenthes gracilis]